MKTRKNCSKGGRKRNPGWDVRFPKNKPAGSKLWRKLQRGGL